MSVSKEVAGVKQILFVCTGNTCRSCMAEGLFNTLIQKHPTLKEEFYAISAGISATNGETASYHARKVLKDEWCIDISHHCAKTFDLSAAADVFLVLTMTMTHKKNLVTRFPNLSAKIFTLKEYVMDSVNNRYDDLEECSLDIQDPYGGSYDIYKECAIMLKDAIDKLILKLDGKC